MCFPRRAFPGDFRVLDWVRPALLLAWLALPVCGQWRSELYPENWQRPDETASFYNDKLIQDFSYAGYMRGEEAIPTVTGPVFDAVATYGADATGTNDSTVAIQNAIDAAEAAGGGVVLLPAGTYKVSPQGANGYSLRISKSNVVLRGAGSASTFLFNTQPVMRGKSVIEVSPTSTTTGSAVLLTADLTGPTRRIPVATPNSFAVGDVVRLEWSFTDDWIAENGQTAYWSATSKPAAAEYLREVTAVDQEQGWIEIDVPTRYTMKTRDGALVRKLTGLLSGAGVEALSIGNAQHPGTTWGENDYNVSGTAAFDVHGSWLLEMRNLRDCWASDVKSYQPPGNTTTAHMLSNGVSLNDSMRVTIKDCWMGRPQYGGGGGNGYMYRIQQSNDCLVQSCTADLSRHGFVISHAGTSGNVFLQCDDRNTKQAIGSGTPYSTGGSGSDNHMHFSHSNLWDSCHAHNSFYTAHHRRTSGTVPHGLTSAHAVYWNTTGSGSYTDIVRSDQGRYGYVIGTSGSRFGVSTTSAATNTGTAPVDHTEGIGDGATLYPASLYLDQLERRLRPVVTYKGNGNTGGSAPVDGSSPYAPGDTVTILGAGDLARTNFSFNGWNTMPDGSGSDYVVSSTFSIDNHLTLYAQWQGTSVTVNFDANGGATPSPTSKTVNLGDAYGSLATTSRAGHTFLGWFTAASGGSEVTSTTTVSTSTTHTLYAQWAVIRTAAATSIDGIIGLAQSGASQPGYYVDRNSSLVGGTGSITTSTRYSMVPVVGFTLPTLPPGHSVQSVKLHYQITAYRYQDDPTFTADAYLLNSADPSTTGTAFYYMGAADPNPNAKLIGSTDLPNGATGSSITADPVIAVSHLLAGDALTNFLTFYSGNTPAQTEAFVRFNRSSADNPDLTNSQVYERFYVDTNPANLHLEITTSGPSSYTIRYDGNGHTGGSAPSAQTKSLGQDLTLSANTGSLVKTGYTFMGWNTAADGSGTTYAEGASYTAEGDVTLHARWQSPFEAWAIANGTGNETFGGDSNGDGIADGLAWLLGAAAPASNGPALLPATSENGGELSLSFRMRKAASRGTALLKLQYSRDLGVTDLWADHSVTVPDTSGPMGGVVFVITPVDGEDFNEVQATIPATAAGGTGRVFVRLIGEMP